MAGAGRRHTDALVDDSRNEGLPLLGLGMVPYMLPSSVELAEATIRTLEEDYDVVMWEKHGVFAVDTDIMDAFDQVDVLNKAAQIYIAARGMGFEPEGMNDVQLRELGEAFGLPK